MRKQFPYCIDLPHGIYDVDGTALAEDGRLIEFTTRDGVSHEPTREVPRTPADELLWLIQEEIKRTCADDIDETREPERADTAPVLV